MALPRFKRLRSILDKLEPPAPEREPLKPAGEPSIVVARMRGTKRRR
jgi:hypothetical protein